MSGLPSGPSCFQGTEAELRALCLNKGKEESLAWRRPEVTAAGEESVCRMKSPGRGWSLCRRKHCQKVRFLTFAVPMPPVDTNKRGEEDPLSSRDHRWHWLLPYYIKTLEEIQTMLIFSTGITMNLLTCQPGLLTSSEITTPVTSLLVATDSPLVRKPSQDLRSSANEWRSGGVQVRMGYPGTRQPQRMRDVRE